MRSIVESEEKPAPSARRAHSINNSPGVPGMGFGNPMPMSIVTPFSVRLVTAGHRRQQGHLVVRPERPVPAGGLAVHHYRSYPHDAVEFGAQPLGELIEERAHVGGIQLEDRGAGQFPQGGEESNSHHATSSKTSRVIWSANDSEYPSSA